MFHLHERWWQCLFLARPLYLWYFSCSWSFFRRLDFGSNLSDQLPLACSLQVDLSVIPPSSAPTQSIKTRIAWHAANSDHIRSFCDLVSHHLPSFPNSICDCCDPQCTVHISDLWTTLIVPSSLCIVNPTHSMSLFLCPRLEYCSSFVQGKG